MLEGGPDSGHALAEPPPPSPPPPPPVTEPAAPPPPVGPAPPGPAIPAASAPSLPPPQPPATQSAAVKSPRAAPISRRIIAASSPPVGVRLVCLQEFGGALGVDARPNPSAVDRRRATLP